MKEEVELMVGRGEELKVRTLSTSTGDDEGGATLEEDAGALLSGVAGDEGTGEGV